jgi:hypothetical protein
MGATKMFLRKISMIGCVLAIASIPIAAQAGDSEAFKQSKTVAAAKKAGGQQISGASILKIVNNKTLKHPKWTWTFKSDGTQSSVAKDKSWTTNGTWEVKGNQLCRTSSEGIKKCSNVYYLDRDLKFSTSKTKLNDWYASY